MDDFGLRRCIVALGFLLISSLLACAHAAHAGCMVAPTQELRSLAELAGRDPTAVLATTEHDPRNTMDAVRFGWRQAARAEAYDTLSRSSDARSTALRMLGRNMASQPHLQIELLTRYAMNGFGSEQINRAIPEVEAARRHVPRGSAADMCLQITLGEMQRMRGAPERAVVYLAEAYRATSDPAMKQQHVIATEKLARVVDWAGDHLQAISLIGEVIASDQARNRTMALSNDLYFRGIFHLGRRAFQAALADFERSRALAPPSIDPVGSAFLDLQICATLIELQVLDRAKAICRRAEEKFTRHGEIAGGQARFLLARIAYAQDEPRLALTLLNPLLARADALSSFASAPQAYRLRSDVNRRLGRTGAAYQDLQVYVREMERQRTFEQAKQSAVLRARFDADRAASRNEELRQRLSFSDAREREQAKRYTVLALSASIGVVLVIIILAMGIYHRRKLTRIANTDPLTGLLNRRSFNEHQNRRISSYTKSGASLVVALVDIDHFKAINDTYGHSAGDEVLVAFARVMGRVLRRGDVIARWGGEEFIVLFPDMTQAEAVDALQRVRDALAIEIHTAAGDVQLKFSAGVASFAGSDDLHTLVQRADQALYRAKGGGRDRTEVAMAEDERPDQPDVSSSARSRRTAAAA
jgi:diguanylate cyclase (GGDEF)-like protein